MIKTDKQARSLAEGELTARTIGETAPRLTLKLRVRGERRSWVVLWRHGLRAPVEGRDGRVRIETPRHRHTLGTCKHGKTDGLTMSEAVDAAHALRQDILAGKNPNDPPPVAGSALAQLVEEYFTSAAGELRPKTIETCRIATGRFLEEDPAAANARAFAAVLSMPDGPEPVHSLGGTLPPWIG